MIKFIRLLSSLLITVAAIFLGYCYFTKQGIFVSQNTEIKIGGDFSLINQNGQIVRSSDFKDKYMMIFLDFPHVKEFAL